MTDEYEMEYTREDELLERISELEEENAELREKVKWYSEQVCFKECAETWEKLTKAKEIIKRLMDIINHDLKCFDTMAGLDIKQKAEQFLKEE